MAPVFYPELSVVFWMHWDHLDSPIDTSMADAISAISLSVCNSLDFVDDDSNCNSDWEQRIDDWTTDAEGDVEEREELLSTIETGNLEED